MATFLKVTTSSTIKQLTPRFHVCNCLADALLGDAHCGLAKTLYVCICAWGLLETNHETTTKPQRNHNETTTKPQTKPLVFSHTINETGGFYKQLIMVPQLIVYRNHRFR